MTARLKRHGRVVGANSASGIGSPRVSSSAEGRFGQERAALILARPTEPASAKFRVVSVLKGNTKSLDRLAAADRRRCRMDNSVNSTKGPAKKGRVLLFYGKYIIEWLGFGALLLILAVKFVPFLAGPFLMVLLVTFLREFPQYPDLLKDGAMT
jgi:hypothetical protein